MLSELLPGTIGRASSFAGIYSCSGDGPGSLRGVVGLNAACMVVVDTLCWEDSASRWFFAVFNDGRVGWVMGNVVHGERP